MGNGEQCPGYSYSLLAIVQLQKNHATLRGFFVK